MTKRRTVLNSLTGALLVSSVAMALAAAVSTVALAQTTTLTHMSSQGWILDPERELAAKFQEETGIAIDFQIIPADQYFNVLKAKLNAGEGPDIFGGQSGVTDLVLNYDVEANAVDLSNEPWADKLDPLVAAQSTVNGKLYGLTYWDTLGNSWVINYSKPIFEQYGISVPTTYEGLKAACQTLLDNSIQPIYEPVSDGWHHVLWFPEIGPAFETANPGLAAALNANEATFAGNETMLTALTQLNELYDMGCMGENALADANADSVAKMANGEVAMALQNTAFASQLAADFPEANAEDYGVFLIPLAGNEVLNLNPAGPTKFIYSGSPNIEAAKQYFEFLTRPENVQYFVDSSPQVVTMPFPDVESEFTPEVQAFMDKYEDARGTVYQTAVTYVNPQWMDIGRDLTAMFTDAMEPADVLESIDQRRADLARAARDPAWQ
jgi:raffinose/stachyose/melibiose transport system substrate-binding protein